MREEWWSLPGPSIFVARIVEQLRRGCSVQVCVPTVGCEGLKRQVGRRIIDDGGFGWESLSLDGEGGDPLNMLYDRIAPGAAVGTTRSSSTLVDESQSRGSVVWLEGIPHNSWNAWRTLLAEFEAASRGKELTERTLLCLPLLGRTSVEAAAADVCLATMEWRGIVTPIDAWIHAAMLNGDRGRSGTQRWLRVATVAQLAMWDPELAEVLADLSSEALLNPLARLSEYGLERGWNRSAAEWAQGTADAWEGRLEEHSAWLAVRGDDLSVRRRLWKAQAQALMPFLEEQRSDLLKEFEGLLRPRLPFIPKNAAEPIEQLHDLELGHIQTLIYERGVDRKVWTRVDCLRKIRNCLSHFELVAADLLFHRSLADQFVAN